MKMLSYVPNKYQALVRDKVISRAKTRIIIAERHPEDFSKSDLEVVIREEEENIKSELREKGLFAALAPLRLNFFV